MDPRSEEQFTFIFPVQICLEQSGCLVYLTVIFVFLSGSAFRHMASTCLTFTTSLSIWAALSCCSVAVQIDLALCCQLSFFHLFSHLHKAFATILGHFSHLAMSRASWMPNWLYSPSSSAASASRCVGLYTAAFHFS